MKYPELKALESDIATCFRCSLCKMTPLPVYKSKEFSANCPINTHYVFHSYSASGLGYMALSLSEGRIEADKTLADIVFSCRTCGYCDMVCKFIMESERSEVNMTLREALVRENLAPEEYSRMVKNLVETGNPAGGAAASPGSWAHGLNLKKVPGQKAKVLLYAGCMTCVDKKAIQSARKLAKLLLHAGEDVGILGGDEKCCGLPAHWAGFKDEFITIAGRNARSLSDSGVKTIVAVCGSCLGALRAKYPRYGISIGAEVIHATELLERLIRKKKLELPRPVNIRATYHDPCYLGRQAEPYISWKGEEKTVFGQMRYFDPPRPIRYGTKGVFDPPRAILQSIKELSFREMYRIREYSHCCGGGGGNAARYDDMVNNATQERIREAMSVGAEYVVTSCSHCKTQLEKGCNGANGKTMQVIDIIDLVFQAAGLE